MASQHALSTLLADNLTKAYHGGNWTGVSILDTIKSLTYAQAQIVTPASVNTIASLVHHIKYWNGIILERLEGKNPVIPPANGFDVKPLGSEEEWQALITETQKSFIALEAAIRGISTQRWDEKPSIEASTLRENAFGIVEHAYYHLGQIVILSHLV